MHSQELKKKIELNSQLYTASKEGNLESVISLLDQKASVNTKDGNDYTVLMAAASEGYEGIVKVLIEQKAEVNRRTKAGSAALHFAARNDEPACVRILLEHKASVNLMCVSDLAGVVVDRFNDISVDYGVVPVNPAMEALFYPSCYENAQWVVYGLLMQAGADSTNIYSLIGQELEDTAFQAFRSLCIYTMKTKCKIEAFVICAALNKDNLLPAVIAKLITLYCHGENQLQPLPFLGGISSVNEKESEMFVPLCRRLGLFPPVIPTHSSEALNSTVQTTQTPGMST